MVEARGSVLIVEDEEVIREVLAAQAEALGLEVYAAENGKEALQVLREKKPDAILSDLRMPQMSGMMLLHTMREQGMHTPFIFVTAFASTETTIQALRLGAFDFIEKPFHASDIEQVLLEAVRVGREQSRLVPWHKRYAKADGNHDAELEATKIAEMQIMKIGTLRLGNDDVRKAEEALSDEAVIDPVGGEQNERKRLIELFQLEALPQLVFCEASLEGLRDEKQRPYELGYLFRVMQALRMSASAMNLDAISTLASTMESVCAYFRVTPRGVRPETIATMHQALVHLKQYTESLTPDGPTATEAELDAELMHKLSELHGKG